MGVVRCSDRCKGIAIPATFSSTGEGLSVEDGTIRLGSERLLAAGHAGHVLAGGRLLVNTRRLQLEKWMSPLSVYCRGNAGALQQWMRS